MTLALQVLTGLLLGGAALTLVMLWAARLTERNSARVVSSAYARQRIRDIQRTTLLQLVATAEQLHGRDATAFTPPPNLPDIVIELDDDEAEGADS